MKNSFYRLRLFALFLIPPILPETLPSHYLRDENFIAFKEMPGTATPLFSALTVNGFPVGTPGTPRINEIFSNSAYAMLPEGATIATGADPSGQVVWQEPIGMEVAHEIVFQDAERSLYELRLMWKISDTQWDFATYTPSDEGTLVRKHYSGNEPFSTTVELTTGASAGQMVQLKLQRLNLMSCERCHLANAENNAPQTPPGSPSLPIIAGPCGFTSSNAEGVAPWIQAYEKKWGHSPFSPAAGI